ISTQSRFPTTTESSTYASTTPSGTQIRLVNGQSPNQGRVEVFYNGSWGTICDDDWNSFDATVVCRMLGYSVGNYYREAFFGSGTGKILLDDVHCNGSERDIDDCPHQPWGTSTSTTTSTTYDTTTHTITQVRLVNGGSPDRGRVEVFYNGSWGTVCDDDWSQADATVVCKMLGYRYYFITFNNRRISGNGYGDANFGRGTGKILLDDVHCTGSETDINDCSHQPWGQSNCDHSEDAGVQCSANVVFTATMSSTTTSATYATTTHTITQIRLVNGGSSDRGRVEVYYNGSWGTVCDDDWSQADATVICKMLGYSSGIGFSDANFGSGTGKILLDDVHCTGSEADINDCSHRLWGQSNCDHSEDAGVQCSGALSTTSMSQSSFLPVSTTDSPTIVRLVNGPDGASGRVEVLHEGRWGTVCDDGFRDSEAMVVCRMLGFQHGTPYSQATYGRGTGEIWIDEINCSGSETNIDQCGHYAWGTGDCDHSEDASVSCTQPIGSTVGYNGATGPISGSIRLVNGNTPNEGRVEVLHNGQWGTVCDDYWTNEDAAVGSEPTWLDDVKCLGSETDIDYCSHATWGAENCGHSEDAGVYCNITSVSSTTSSVAVTTSSTPTTRIRLVDGASNSEGRVEVFYNGQWGTVCDDFWVTSDANVICRMLGYKNGTAFTSAHFGQGSGSIFLDDVKCHGNETDIDQCAHAPWTQSNCGHSEDA
ncbi:hypothetical protein KUTeg_017190, partial [Tegillarca granosa]